MPGCQRELCAIWQPSSARRVRTGSVPRVLGNHTAARRCIAQTDASGSVRDGVERATAWAALEQPEQARACLSAVWEQDDAKDA
jgi:hypothetical protein